MSFLRAEWRKLALANYAVDKELLQKHLPSGTEFDLWEGRCYVSLVGFMFVNTRLMGMKVPFHVNFEEVNLRFYVKRMVNGELKRGVVFIKEIVPKAAITFVANSIYHEHYQTLPMGHTWIEDEESLLVEYSWKTSQKENRFKIITSPKPEKIDIGSEAEFITEHYWGYTRIDESNTYEYEVTHPRWLHYPVNNYDISVDFGTTYGSEFSWLDDLNPLSVFLAEGSEITVENKLKIVI